MVCISPLTSLMIKQQAKFQSLSVKAELVGEVQVRDDKEVEKSDIRGIIISIYYSREHY